jgi:transposase
VTVVLPGPLRHLANAPRGRYRLACSVAFHHRRSEWLDRVDTDAAVRYDIVHDPQRGRWYIDASWTIPNGPPPTPDRLRHDGVRLLGVDLNHGHLAACAIDAHGNPVGQPITVATDLTGPSSQRDGRLRAAISGLIREARRQGCGGIAVENLSFPDARASGRETLGRGRRGKRFRRLVAGLPTGRFRERLRGMACHAGLPIVAVDPAYTSRWGAQHWLRPLQQQSRTTATAPVTGHHGAAVAIGRRALGYGVRRRPGVTRARPEDRAGRATGQTVPRPRERRATDPPRTVHTPHPGGKTHRRRSGSPVPSLSRRPFAGHPGTHGVSVNRANSGQ